MGGFEPPLNMCRYALLDQAIVIGHTESYGRRMGGRRPRGAPGEEDPGVACLRRALLGLLTDRA